MKHQTVKQNSVSNPRDFTTEALAHSMMNSTLNVDQRSSYTALYISLITLKEIVT